MKSVLKVSLLAATIMLAVGCQQEKKETPKTAAPETVVQSVDNKISDQNAESAAVSTFKSEDEKGSYALGAYFGEQLKKSIEQSEKIGAHLDSEAAKKGFNNASDGASLLTEEEIQQELNALSARFAEQAKAKAEQDATEAKNAGDAFRADFEKQNGVKKTKSGLLYQVLTPAKGPSPKESDSVEVHYKGTFVNGETFDSSYERNEPVTFPLADVIPGWTEGLQLMQVGSKYKFVISPELAYGSDINPNSPIPANSTLVFEVELLKIVQPKAATPATK